MTDQDWRDRAACLGHDPELWFPDSTSTKRDLAERICQGCPVQSECRQFAARSCQAFGIWGGIEMTLPSSTAIAAAQLSDAEVVAIRRRRAGGETLADLAAEFGISRSMAGAIARGTRRADAGGPIQATRSYRRSA